MKIIVLILKFLAALAQRSPRSAAPKPSPAIKPPAPAPIADPAIADAARLRARMGGIIVGYEARRDAHGRLTIYKLPTGDGGGAYEIAGINDKYHPQQAARLASLIRNGNAEEAERQAAEYVAAYTDAVDAWSESPAVDFWNRDCCFNRGPGGAAAILQIALGVTVDAKVGPKTLAALAAAEHADIAGLLGNLRRARESYERRTFAWKPHGRDESSRFWRGLVNRWDKALRDAQSFLWQAKPAPKAQSTAHVATGPEAPWAGIAAKLIGTRELAGGGDNSTIVAWAAAIVAKYPDLRGYVGWYDHDSIPWCGLFVAYCMAMSGHKPPQQALGAVNWFDAWADGQRLAGPALGAVMVKTRKGGGHVTFYMGEDDDHYFCLGGNQSDAVNVARIRKDAGWLGFMWPKEAALPAKIGPVRRSFAQAKEVTEA